MATKKSSLTPSCLPRAKSSGPVRKNQNLSVRPPSPAPPPPSSDSHCHPHPHPHPHSHPRPSTESLSPWDDNDDFQDEAHTQAYIFEIWGLNAPVLGNDDSEEEIADTTSGEASAETKLARVSAPARASSPPLRNRVGHTRSSSEPVRAAKTPLTLPRFV